MSDARLHHRIVSDPYGAGQTNYFEWDVWLSYRGRCFTIADGSAETSLAASEAARAAKSEILAGLVQQSRRESRSAPPQGARAHVHEGGPSEHGGMG